GKFEVILNPIDSYATSKDGIKLGRMSIDKTFSGELSATSKGEMLSALTSKAGSAGYVAIELVTGELNGKKGSFALQHFGTMSNGEQNLLLEVVPDSGVGELAALTGKMDITIEDGQHFYTFEYEL
ncbi:MAG: DUF3224 domain-containing protein, partial [Colwellia sp.]|nr:DUF3224 domain-containing protein [Colwellia sp.]